MYTQLHKRYHKIRFWTENLQAVCVYRTISQQKKATMEINIISCLWSILCLCIFYDDCLWRLCLTTLLPQFGGVNFIEGFLIRYKIHINSFMDVILYSLMVFVFSHCSNRTIFLNLNSMINWNIAVPRPRVPLIYAQRYLHLTYLCSDGPRPEAQIYIHFLYFTLYTVIHCRIWLKF